MAVRKPMSRKRRQEVYKNARLGNQVTFPAADSPSETQEIAKATSDFARIAVPPTNGMRPEPANHNLDRREYLENYRGSTYIAIGAIARKVAMQEAQVFHRRRRRSGVTLERARDTHLLYDVFREVNQIHTQYDLWFYLVGWRLMLGVSYLWKARNGFNKPREVWPIPPQWVFAVPSPRRFIDHYRVVGVFGRDPVRIPADDIIQFSEPTLDWSGTNRFYGQPPATHGGTMIDIEREMLNQAYHRYKNFIPPGMHYETSEFLSQDQFDEIYAQLVIQRRMSEQSGSPILSHSGLKAGVAQQTRSPLEREAMDGAMDFILATYGVPRAVVGLAANFNRANMQAAMLGFAEGTVNPLLVSMSQHLTQGFSKEFGEDIVVRIPPVAVDDMDQLRRNIDTALRAGAITPNEVRELLFEMDEFPEGGNRPMVMQTIVPQQYGNAGPDEPGVPASPNDPSAQPPKKPAPTPAPPANETDRAKAILSVVADSFAARRMAVPSTNGKH